MPRPVQFGLMYPVADLNPSTLDAAAKQLRYAAPPGQVEVADFWLSPKPSISHETQVGFKVSPAIKDQPVPDYGHRVVMVITEKDVPKYRAIQPALAAWSEQANLAVRQKQERPKLPTEVRAFVERAAGIIANALQNLNMVKADTALELLAKGKFDVETGKPIGAYKLNVLSLAPEGHTLQ